MPTHALDSLQGAANQVSGTTGELGKRWPPGLIVVSGEERKQTPNFLSRK